MKGIEIIGYDAASKGYLSRHYDSQGNTGTEDVSVRNDIWTFTGEKARATVVFSDDGNTFTHLHEWSDEGVNWLPWTDVKSTKAA